MAETIQASSVPGLGADDIVLDSDDEGVDLEELLAYRSVPPRRVVAMSFQFRQLGRGRPLPYRFEEDSED